MRKKPKSTEEGWICLSEAHRRVGRPYKCCLCHRSISTNELHVYRVGRRNGTLVQMRMHPSCEFATREWSDEQWRYAAKGDVFLLNADQQIQRFYSQHLTLVVCDTH